MVEVLLWLTRNESRSKHLLAAGDLSLSLSLSFLIRSFCTSPQPLARVDFHPTTFVIIAPFFGTYSIEGASNKPHRPIFSPVQRVGDIPLLSITRLDLSINATPWDFVTNVLLLADSRTPLIPVISPSPPPRPRMQA
jgi:hypothetical protein